MSRILVVEDDAAILRGLKDSLEAVSYEVLTARDGEAGYQLLEAESPDLVILDVMLPRVGGFEFCSRARKDGLATPILMLTARGEEADRVFGLELGADDYVTKPFSVRELLARVKALLRRSNAQSPLPDELRFDDVVVDFVRYEARKGDQPLKLTRKEWGTLRYLAARPGEVVSRDEFLTKVWDYHHHPTTRTVDNHIATLRAKLETDAAEPRHLITVHGIGYKLVL